MTYEDRHTIQRFVTGLVALAILGAVFAAGAMAERRTSAAAAADMPEPEETAEEIEPVAEPEPVVEPEQAEIVQVAIPAEPEETAPSISETVQTAPIAAEKVETTPVPYYPLTDADRALVASVVMAEAGGEDYDGQRLVAQCILGACLKDGLSPDEAVVEYQYTSVRKTPSESVLQAVSAVFDYGDFVVDDQVLYFYAPALTTSEWHESQRYIMTHGNHKFFGAWGV